MGHQSKRLALDPAGIVQGRCSTGLLHAQSLANTLNACSEQYVLHLAALAGSSYTVKRIFRAYNLAKYVKLKDQPSCLDDVRWAADLARAAPHERSRAE